MGYTGLRPKKRPMRPFFIFHVMQTLNSRTANTMSVIQLVGACNPVHQPERCSDWSSRSYCRADQGLTIPKSSFGSADVSALRLAIFADLRAALRLARCSAVIFGFAIASER